VMRAQAAVPLGRGRFTELALLIWIATIAITGFVAVLATETASFRPTAVVVPLVFLALMLSLHVFLVGIRFRGDQLLLPIAAYLEEYREVLSHAQRRIGPFPVPPVPYLVPIVAMWVIAMLVMVFEKDMGATVLFFGIFLAMLFLATGEAFYAIIGLVLLVLGGIVAYQLFGHVQARVDTWLRPFDEDLRFGTGYQLIQGLYALANGGLIGVGLGNGMPDRIPIVWSDFVFDAFAEEAGLAGAIALLALYLVFLYRGML